MVDDGSTDETAAVAARYAERGVRYVHRPRGGAGQARNAGLEVTSAPLVAFLDADDAWLPHRVEAGVAHLERHPEAALVAAHAFACDEGMRPSSRRPRAARPARRAGCSTSCSIHNVVLNPSSVLIRRSALEAAGGFSEIPFGQDWDTWLEIAKRFPIGFIDRPLALVRRHTGSITPRSASGADRRQPRDRRPPPAGRPTRLEAAAAAARGPPRRRAFTPAWAAPSRATGAGRAALRDRRARARPVHARAAQVRCCQVFVSSAGARLSRAARDVALAELTGKRS